MFPFWAKILEGQNSVEERDKKENRPQWKVLQSPVRYTVRVRCLAYFDIPDGFLNLIVVRNSGSLAGAKEWTRSATSTASVIAGYTGTVTG